MKKTVFVLSIIILCSLYLNSTSQVSQSWVRKYNGPGGNRIDIATAITSDSSGNIYVTGQSQGYGNNYDYVTIKYNSSGVQQWLARYNGPGDTTDYAAAIAVDRFGNVYVTGFSVGPGTGNDFATIKYSSAGIQQWVSRYNGTGNSNDAGRSIAVDDSGYVYVTGESWGGSSNYDFATIKYNSAGVQIWAVRFNGPGNYVDEPAQLAVDHNGNVYVTGYTIQTNDNYLTLKYNSQGVQQWAAIYNGTGNGADEAKSIALDNSGNAYITGRSFQSGTTFDYTTIKYNSATGDSVWVVRYNGPANGSDEASSIFVDASGNVYVTGNSTGILQDVATVMYNSAGIQQWATRYNGPANSHDYGLNVVADASGNVYVSGYTFNGGTLHDEDYLVLKYNSTGVQQWVQRFNGPVNSFDVVAAVTLDTAGNVYVTGQSEGDGSGLDVVTIKYNPQGDSVWVRRYNGPGNSNDYPSSIFADRAGNVYVVGVTWATGDFQSAQYLTIKYNSSGAQQWAAIFPGGGYFSGATSVAADTLGNVYVTGNYRFGSGGSQVDYGTIKYSPAGDTLWVRRYNFIGLDEAKKIFVDNAGFIYVTGRSNSTNNLDFLTIKYNPSGDTVWTARYNGIVNNWDEPADMAVDLAGNVYVTGFSRSSTLYGSEDYATVKYNSSGIQQWASRYNGPGNFYDAPSSLALDTSANIVVTGASYGNGTSYDFATVKYGSAGDTVFIQRYNGPGNSVDKGTSVKTDLSGNVYVTGCSGNGSAYNLTNIKYSAPGNQQWIYQYNANLDSAYTNSLLAIDRSGNVYIASNTFENGTDYDILLIKLSPVIGIDPIGRSIPKEFRLYQNYPNPFNPVTKIRFDIPGETHSNVSLQIYDVLGREVATLINKELKPGTYEVEWDGTNYPSGVYYYRLNAGDASTPLSITQTKKMVLLK